MQIEVYLNRYRGYPDVDIVTHCLAKNYKARGIGIKRQGDDIVEYENGDVWLINNWGESDFGDGWIAPCDMIYCDSSYCQSTKESFRSGVKNSLTPAIVQFTPPPLPKPSTPDLSWKIEL